MRRPPSCRCSPSLALAWALAALLGAMPSRAQDVAPPTTTLRGVVLLPDGVPAAGASVELSRHLARESNALVNDPREVVVAAPTCGDDGTFAVDLAAGRPHVLRCRAGKNLLAVRDLVFAGEDLRVQLERGAHVEGIVLDAEGRPVAGATVRGWSSGASLELFHTLTNGAGYYAATSLPPGFVFLKVRLPASGPEKSTTVELLPARTARCDLSVAALEPWTGTVVDAATKQPLRGAEVASASFRLENAVVTRDDGSFVVHGSGGEIDARAPGYGRIRIKPAGATSLVIALERGRTARGTLVDTQKQPIVGAEVVVMANVHSGDLQQLDWLTTRTDRGGAFAFDAVRHDLPHCLFVRADGYGTAVYDFPADESTREAIDLGIIELSPAVYLTGRALDENGQPLAGISVTLKGTNGDRYRFSGGTGSEPRGSFYINSRRTFTDSLGRYHIADVAPGSYEVRALAEEVTPRLVATVVIEAKQWLAEVGPTDRLLTHDFALRLGRVVHGRVRMPSGRTPPTVRVVTTAEGAARKPLLLRQPVPFRLFDAPVDAFELTIEPSDMNGSEATLDGMTRSTRSGVRAERGSVVLFLGEAGWLQAVVVDETGRAVGGVQVAALGDDGRELARGETDVDGSVAFDLRSATEVTLVAKIDGRTVRVRCRVGDANVVLAPR
ncbi:MAG: carboxypeptidase regulatory-like domain-containing protein [Planctomycetota bacterium]